MTLLSAANEHHVERPRGARECERLAPLFLDLCALGPVLCLYPPAAPVAADALRTDAPWPAQPELVGLVTAREMRLECRIDNHGPHEGLWFGTPPLAPVFAIFLLPDSDYLAWERLLGLALESAWQPISVATPAHARGFGWTAGIRRFRLIPVAQTSVLAFEPVRRISSFGLQLVEHVLRDRGAGRADDC